MGVDMVTPGSKKDCLGYMTPLQKGQTYREEAKPTKNFENCEGSSQDS
jgi:hypothetical protein